MFLISKNVDANETCKTCANPNFLSENLLWCAVPINNCSAYANNLNCEICAAPNILTSGRLACATPIVNCTSYSMTRSVNHAVMGK